jgi:hypothetical protein
VCLWNVAPRFLKPRLEVFFNRLLHMESNDVPEGFLAPLIERIGGEKILLGFRYPLTGA